MIILGIDSSKNGTGIVISELDEDFNIVDIDYLSFTQTKKYSTNKVLLHHKKNSFNDDISKAIFMRKSLCKFINSFLSKGSVNNVDYTAIEDYSFASMGRTEDKAELAGMYKALVMEMFDTNLRKYSPKSIKKHATLTGNADKTLMCDTYLDGPNVLEFSEFQLQNIEKYNDLIDAYYIMEMLREELYVRKTGHKVQNKKKEQALTNYLKLDFDNYHEKLD